MGSVSEAHPGPDTGAWLGYLADPEVRIVTLTVTEAGYVRGADGGLDSERRRHPDDLGALRSDLGRVGADRTGPAGRRARRPAGRRRRSADRGVVRQPARQRRRCRPGGRTTSPACSMPTWPTGSSDNVSFVTTMVDRITPATTAGRHRLRRRTHRPRRRRTRCHRTVHRMGARPASSPAAARPGRTPAPGSSTTSLRSRNANSGCSTGRTRCSPTPAAPAATRPSPRRSPIRSAWTG